MVNLTLKPLVGKEPWFKVLTLNSRVYIVLCWIVRFLFWFLWIIVRHSKNQSHHPSEHLISAFFSSDNYHLQTFLTSKSMVYIYHHVGNTTSQFPAGTSISLQASSFSALHLCDHGTSVPPLTRPATSATFTPTNMLCLLPPRNQLESHEITVPVSTALSISCVTTPIRTLWNGSSPHPQSFLPIQLITNAIFNYQLPGIYVGHYLRNLPGPRTA